MNLKFMNLVLEKCTFPEEACIFFRELADRLIAEGYEAEFDSIVDEYITSKCHCDMIDGKLKEFAAKAGNTAYEYWMLLLILAVEQAKPLYDKRGVPEEVFWDTFSDLRCKALECKEIKGVWGTFVAGWYGLFYLCRIIKFGRLEYQDAEYWEDEAKTYGGVTFTKGKKMLSLHIPSSGEPFDREARLKSYKMAYDFYTKELGTDYLPCYCGSWLMYPPYKAAFPAGSNSRSFMDDFEYANIHSKEPGAYHEFGDRWRVFGKDSEKPLAELPEDTSMRRGFKKYFLDGGCPGSANGYLIFDGEKVLTWSEK